MTGNKNLSEIIKKTEKIIHIIELYIHPALFRPIFKRFNDEFVFKGTDSNKNKSKVEHHFRINHHIDSAGLIIRYFKERDDPFSSYFISINKFDKKLLRKLLKILKSEINNNTFLKTTDPNNACCIHYVESALDFYPEDIKDIDAVFEHLATGLFFKYGRSCEHEYKELGDKKNKHKCPTLYLGKKKIAHDDPSSLDWNVFARNQLHGLRIYYRPIDKSPEYIRFEYVANKMRLIDLGLRDLNSLPDISTDKIRPLNYVLYRKRSQYDLYDSICNKLHSMNKKISPIGVSTVIDAHKSLMWHGLYPVEGNPDESKKERREKLYNRKTKYPHDIMEIVAEVDAFKELKKKYRLSYNLDKFFPADNQKLQAIKSMVPYP